MLEELIPQYEQYQSLIGAIIVERHIFLPDVESFLDDGRFAMHDLNTDVHVGYYQGRPLAAVVGTFSPHIALKVEQLATLFMAPMVVRIGTCGSLQSHLNRGDVAVALAAIRNEGTSACYEPHRDIPAMANWTMLSRFVPLLGHNDIPYSVGTIWTTDGRYAESDAQVANYSRWGALAVDMETSALYTVATYKNLPALSLGIISDMPIDDLGLPQKGFKGAEEFEYVVIPRVQQLIRLSLDVFKAHVS